MSKSNTMEAAQSEANEWEPARLIRRQVQSTNGSDDDGLASSRFALVVLNQPLPANLNVIRRLWDNAHFRIAADGGANCLYDAAGQHGDTSFDDLAVIIGDLDSLTPQTQTYYSSRPAAQGDPSQQNKPKNKTSIIRITDQESTDFGKAVTHIRAHHHHANGTPLDIVAIGGLGGRVDQGLSQLHHLYLFQTDARYAQGRMYLFSGESLTFLLKAGRHRIRVRDGPAGEGDVFGKYVGLLPIGGPARITTRGLEWDVTDWETRFGGRMSTSNHVLPETEVVEVETTEDVLWTIALRQS